MTQIYTTACIALVKDDISRFSKKFNKPLIKDYDDLDYFEALLLELPNGIPYVLQRYRGYEDNIFVIFIPPAIENYKDVILTILDILDIPENKVTLYLEDYERMYAVEPWNKRIKELEKRKSQFK